MVVAIILNERQLPLKSAIFQYGYQHDIFKFVLTLTSANY